MTTPSTSARRASSKKHWRISTTPTAGSMPGPAWASSTWARTTGCSRSASESEDPRPLVVHLATLQGSEFPVQGRQLLGVPGRKDGTTQHGHRRPAEHPAGADHLEDIPIGEAGLLGKPVPQVEQVVQGGTVGKGVEERPRRSVDRGDLRRVPKDSLRRHLGTEDREEEVRLHREP